MAEPDDACWLTVKADGSITLRHAGKEFESAIHEDRRATLIVQRFDRLAKDYPSVCEQHDLALFGETLFDMLFGQAATEVSPRTSSACRMS